MPAIFEVGHAWNCFGPTPFDQTSSATVATVRSEYWGHFVSVDVA